MKILNYSLCLLILSLAPVFGQQTKPGENTFGERVAVAEVKQKAEQAAVTLTKFSLDFPGGTPDQLVAAIEKAMSRPLNAIIPEEHTGMKLPPLKLANVTVPDLFQALRIASSKTEPYLAPGSFGIPGQRIFQQKVTSYGFETADKVITDDSVWYFRVDGLNVPPLVSTKDCRFYSLAPYLSLGYSVDDITTAVQTGWKMQGDTPTPQISFHKETKLLIAVGEPSKLETIDAVLKALNAPKPSPTVDPATGLSTPKAGSSPEAK